MPTSQQEAVDVITIVADYLDEADAKELMARLSDEIGEHTENDSLKVSLQMLKTLYEPAPKPKKIDQVWPCALAIVVSAHMLVVTINMIAFFVLPFTYPVYVWMPLNSFILITIFSRSLCPLTRLENYLRQKVGKPTIGGFIGHYIIKPIRHHFDEKANI